MMKWIILFLAILPSPLYAQKLKDWSPQFQAKFCGLDTLHDSSLLEDCDAQSAQNVLTDRGYLEERQGMTRIINSVLTGFPVKQLYEFVTTSNSRYVIAHASQTVYQSNLSGSPVSIATVAASQNLECASLSGSLVCDDGSGSMWSWNGTSTSTVGGTAPICTFLATEYGRMFCGAPITDLSQVAVSSYPGFGYWTPSTIVPLPANSATSFEFNPNDGDSIQCMKTTPWGLFVGKKNSSYILKGYDNTTFYIQTIDPVIGCSDQRTFQMVNGIATWMSQKGIYQWEGRGPPIWISEKIDPTFRNIRQLASNSNFWEMQSQQDWQSGSSSLNGALSSWDSTNFPGSIFPSSTTFSDIFTSSINAASLMSGVSTSSPNGLSLNFSSGTTILSSGQSWSGSIPSCGSASGPNAVMSCTDFGNWAMAVYTSTVASSYGIWKSTMESGSYYTSVGESRWLFISDSLTLSNVNGYSVDLLGTNNSNFTFTLNRYAAGVKTILATKNFSVSGGYASCSIVINRDFSGNFILTIGPSSSSNLCSSFTLNSNDNSYFTTTYQDVNLYQTITAPSQCGFKACPLGGSRVKNISLPFYSYNPTSGLFQSAIFDMQFSTPLAGPFNVFFSSPAGTGLNFAVRSATSTSGVWTSWTAISTGAISSNLYKEFWQYESSFTTTLSTVTPSISSITLIAVSTGVFSSPVHFLTTFPNFTWKSFNVQDNQQSPGQFFYSIRAATYSFISTATIPNYTTVPNNQTITISTGAYFQWQVSSSSMTSSTQAISLINASITKSFVNWQEGSSAKPASSFISNDSCLVFQRNRDWTLFNGPSISAMSPFNFNIIAGDGSSNSKVWYWMQDNIYDDDGATINSAWTSKDFIIGSPFNQKTFYEVWTDNKYSQGATLDIGWSMDKNPTLTKKTINLDNTGTGQVSGNNITVTRTYPDKGYELGKYVRFNFSQNSLDLPWRLNSYLFYVDVQIKQAQ